MLWVGLKQELSYTTLSNCIKTDLGVCVCVFSSFICCKGLEAMMPQKQGAI